MVTHAEIDFELVREIFDQIHNDDYRKYLAGEFPELEADVAGLALIEQQNIGIAGSIRIIFAAKGLRDGLGGVIDILKGAYDELDIDSKHMLLPIFFSGDMQGENLAFIKDKQERDAAFMVFLDLIIKDGLVLDDLKDDFIKQYPLCYLLPLHSHLENAGSSSKSEETQNQTDNAGASLDDFSSQETRVEKPAELTGTSLDFLGATLFFLGKVLLLLFAWGVIFVAWPQSGKIELPVGVQWLLAIGATIWIWNGCNSWYAKRRKK